jgi:hypothetical protein
MKNPRAHTHFSEKSEPRGVQRVAILMCYCDDTMVTLGCYWCDIRIRRIMEKITTLSRRVLVAESKYWHQYLKLYHSKE